MRSIILAALVALSTTAAFAQEKEMAVEMASGLSMLETSASRALQQYGLEADVMSLSLGQIAEIQSVLTQSMSDSDTKAALEAALRR